MGETLKEARLASEKGEIPVGAVVVLQDEVIASAHNLRESTADPTAHAEIIALRKASRKLGGWRLVGATLYVNLEPCIMCMGALIQARISRLVFGALDPKGGAAGSLYRLDMDERLNHRIEVISGVREGESRELLWSFFRKLRSNFHS